MAGASIKIKASTKIIQTIMLQDDKRGQPTPHSGPSEMGLFAHANLTRKVNTVDRTTPIKIIKQVEDGLFEKSTV